LVTLLLVAALVAQQEARASATVDRTDVLAGEVVTLSIRVEATGGEPVRILNPELTGLQVRGSRDVTQVRMVEGEPRRIVTRELKLLAVSPGRAAIGPVRIAQGADTTETAAIIVSVRQPAAVATTGAAPRVRALLDTLTTPTLGSDVVVEVFAIPGTVTAGDQLDLVTLAWFPRDVRLQLRTPPALDPPAVEGVWSYQQATSAGVVTSRQSGGRWYDLYVSHQVVFPLAPGLVRAGPATVTYVQPLSYSFLSRELQHEVQSESLAVEVRPLPATGRPAAFSGAAARDLDVILASSSETLAPGAAATVTATLTGVGNVALWPEPRFQWPPGLRVYPGEVAVEVEARDGLIAGTKRFSYLVVADSAGTHPLPGIVYPYFNPATGRYVSAGAPGLVLVAPLGAAPPVERPLPPGLLSRDVGRAARGLGYLATWVWIAVFLLPPLVLLAALAVRRLRRALPGPEVRVEMRGRLDALDHDLRQSLAGLVGPASDDEGPVLMDSLRAAGVDPSLAAHVARVRERLRQAVFGPNGSADTDELSAEVREVLRALAGDTPGRVRRAALPVTMLLLLLAPNLTAQAPRPEELYGAGAFRAAADSFALRTASEPRVAAYWYNLGAAYYRLGEDGRARAAWLRAARLAPRHSTIKRVRSLFPEDDISRSLAPVAWATPAEMLAVGALLWLVAWALVVLTRVRRIAVAVMTLGLAGAATAAWVQRRYAEPIGVVLPAEVPLRPAPYGSASADRRVYGGSVVRVLRREGAWLLVERGDARGWVLPGEVARL
jgi:hypothetical protein